MLGRVVLICALLVAPSPLAAQAQPSEAPTKSTAPAPQKDAAETIFAKTASKIVFLITRKSGEIYSSASGVILSADGYVATNYHALQGADAVEIRFFPDPGDSEDYQSFNGAKLLYADPEHDIAVLKVNSNSLPFLRCPANTGCEARVGEKVYAIGNPKGLSNTISEGIVSALRSWSVDSQDVIQHTAPISPGSSGGALVDSSGALIGMNSWQVADAQNLNFAISSKHLLAALASARQSTTALSYPPAAPADSGGHATEDTVWQASQPSVEALHAIADAMKQCPQWVSPPVGESGPLTGFELHLGPAINVVWDVVASSAIRSPYLGYVEFTLPKSGSVPDSVYQKYKDKAGDTYRDLLFKPIPGLKYRYEFDLGPSELQLTRVLEREEDTKDWKDSKAGIAAEHVKSALCWDQAARNGQTAGSPRRP